MPFRDVVGHRRLIHLLARSIQHDRLPPSLLFAGPTEGAARDTAVAVAQALNCTKPIADPQLAADTPLFTTDDQQLPFDSCGRCATCTRIARGLHPDVLVIEPADTGLIRIDPVREAVDRSSYRPFEGRRRVVIVDDASVMVPQAQNALLKTLEEPPPSSVFILVTARPDVLLPTVRSRLVRLTFADSGPATLDPEAREVAERVLVRAVASSDPGRRLEAARDLLVNTGGGGAGDREQLASHLRAIAVLLRDVEIVATGADARLLAQPDATPTLDRLTRAFRGTRGVDAFFAIDRGLEALRGNAGVKVVADWVALQL